MAQKSNGGVLIFLIAVLDEFFSSHWDEKDEILWFPGCSCLGCVVPASPPLSAALRLLRVDRERSSVDHYKQSESVSHATNAGFCPGKQIWEFLPRLWRRLSQRLQYVTLNGPVLTVNFDSNEHAYMWAKLASTHTCTCNISLVCDQLLLMKSTVCFVPFSRLWRQQTPLTAAHFLTQRGCFLLSLRGFSQL